MVVADYLSWCFVELKLWNLRKERAISILKGELAGKERYRLSRKIRRIEGKEVKNE